MLQTCWPQFHTLETKEPEMGSTPRCWAWHLTWTHSRVQAHQHHIWTTVGLRRLKWTSVGGSFPSIPTGFISSSLTGWCLSPPAHWWLVQSNKWASFAPLSNHLSFPLAPTGTLCLQDCPLSLRCSWRPSPVLRTMCLCRGLSLTWMSETPHGQHIQTCFLCYLRH